jgi:mannose-6-phosphate isomerase
MGGSLIAEIQQNSNTTYRVYDWNRVGADGKPRPLHIDKALDVIDFRQVERSLNQPIFISEHNGVRREQLCANRYFVTERVTMAAGATFAGMLDGRTLEIWGVLAGGALVNDIQLSAIQFCLLPAALGEYTITAESPATLLRTYVAENAGV